MYIEKIQYIIELCSNYNKLSQNSSIHIYLNDFPKFVSNDIISPIHINSAFTQFLKNKRKIIIFRKEEWYKVLIHECFHLFSLDFRMDDKTNILFKKNVFMNSHYLLFECYAEFWARLLNICIYLRKFKWTTFIKKANQHIYYEKIYTMMCCKKILTQFEFDINDFYVKPMKWKENTNMYCYYILTSVLFYNFEETMIFFKQYNHNLLYFNQQYVDLFMKFILEKINYYNIQYDKIKHYNINQINMTHLSISF